MAKGSLPADGDVFGEMGVEAPLEVFFIPRPRVVGGRCEEAAWPLRLSKSASVSNPASTMQAATARAPARYSSQPGMLEDLIESSGMTVTDVAEIECPFTFPDMEAFWTGCISAGPVQAVLEIVDTMDLRRRLEEAASPYQLADGSVRFDVTFRYVSAKTSG